MEVSTIILIAVLVVAVGAAAVWFATRGSLGSRHRKLKERFGPEYDREVERQGSVSRAEQELMARKKRVEKFDVRTLSEADHQRFHGAWAAIQAQFVDDPQGAITAADDLIQAVMEARGYSHADFDQRVADLSVQHADVVDHYRQAHDVAEENRAGRASTEKMRQAVVHYRALFADLLGDSQATLTPTKEVHA